jgi:hypothetical protein
MGGGGMDIWLTVSFAAGPLPALRLPLRATRSAMSMLASVVSLGSPGSTDATWSLFALELSVGAVRSEFARCLLWLCGSSRLDSGAVVSPSSAEASRDEFCSIWSIRVSSGTVLFVGMLLRLRFPWEELIGEDMRSFRAG